MGQTQIGRSTKLQTASVQGVGLDLPAKTTLVLTHGCHRINGSGSITTITPPGWMIPGDILRLIPKKAFTTTTSGNIARAMTAVEDVPVFFLWDGLKFYPSY